MRRRPKVIDADFRVVSGPRQSMTPAAIAWAATMVALMIPLAASDYWHASIPDWYQPFAGGAGTVATGGLINRWRDVRPGYDFRVLFRFGRLIRSAAKRLHGNRRAHQLR